MLINGRLFDFNKPLTMGVINLTSDSFHSGSRAAGVEAAVALSGKMIADGADILDFGAYSTRPGAGDVNVKDEIAALIPVIEKVAAAFPEMIISADTFRSEVARAAVKAGAQIINDVGGGLFDPAMFETVASLGVPYILMHNRSMPQTMNQHADYKDVVNDVVLELSQKVHDLRLAGVSDIIIDPGFGFAKTVEHNYEMMMRLEEFDIFGLPILVGISRKSMIWRTLNTTPEHALNGTTALHMLALERGAGILRVHDVKEAREAIAIWERCLPYRQTNPTYKG